MQAEFLCVFGIKSCIGTQGENRSTVKGLGPPGGICYRLFKGGAW